MNQYRSNYQQPDQRNQQPMQQQPILQNQQASKSNQYRPNSNTNMNQKVQIPEDWEGMMEFVSTPNDPELKHRVHQKIHEQLFQE